MTHCSLQSCRSIFIGEIPQGLDLVLHPFAYAGWVGLFVTALNLLPVGQLDGGHVVYAVFGNKSKWVFRVSIALLAALAIFYNPGWLTLVILLLIFGRRHPQPYDTETQLDSKRKFVAFIVLVIFILSFIPAPFPEMNTANILDMIRKEGNFQMSSNDVVAILLLFVTMFFWGATPLLEKMGLKEVEPLTGILIRSGTITIVLLVIYLFNGRIHELTKISLKNYSLFAASGIMAGLIAMWTYYYLLKTGMTSKIVPIAAAYPFITAILSIVILGEQVTFQRMIGIGFTIAGIILIQQS